LDRLAPTRTLGAERLPMDALDSVDARRAGEMHTQPPNK
jgi:hypothetical protein